MTETPRSHPLESYAPDLFNRDSPTSDFGITIRKGDARLRLQEMRRVEEATSRQEQLDAEIADNITRMNAEHALNMQYLIEFGVRADERYEFQRILCETAEHGGMSLREAANLAHARVQRNGSGDTDVSPVESPSLSL